MHAVLGAASQKKYKAKRKKLQTGDRYFHYFKSIQGLIKRLGLPVLEACPVGFVFDTLYDNTDSFFVFDLIEVQEKGVCWQIILNFSSSSA